MGGATAGRRVPAGAAFATVLLVALAVGGAVAAERERTWGLGYDEGVTVRRVLAGDWEVGLAAGPNDWRSEGDRTEWSEQWGAEYQDLTLPDDTTREQGWVRLDLARRVMQEDRLSLAVVTGLRYGWSRYQSTRASLDIYGEGIDVRRIDDDDDSWRLTLAARPAFTVSPRLTIEFDFGLYYEWQHSVRTETWDDTREDQDRGIEYLNDDKSFKYFGWNGLGSLNFIFWL